MPIIIMSDSGRFKAIIGRVTEAGFPVEFWERDRADQIVVWRSLYETTLDAPHHVVCDRVHDIVQQLRREVRPWPTRHTVLELVR